MKPFNLRSACIAGLSVALLAGVPFCGPQTSTASPPVATAPVKYAGVHYAAWFNENSLWDQVWGTNSNPLHFEDGDYTGFTITGTAFGSAPRSSGHGSLSGWEDRYWADSFTGGEAAVGTLTSDPFTVRRGSFRFKAAGWDGASGTDGKNAYYLKRASDDAILFTAKPPQSDAFAWITWDTSAYIGTEVYFQAVDNHTGSGYAWLAIDGQTPVIPAIGEYTSDAESAELHAEMLKDMGVDFALLDNSNNTIWSPTDSIWDSSKAIAEGFSAVPGGPKAAIMLSITTWDGDTTRVQRLLTKNYTTGYPWIPANSGDLFLEKVSRVYNELANDPDKYFYYEDKPLLALFVSASGTVYDEHNVDQTPNGKLADSWNPVIPDTGGAKLRDLFTIRWVGAFQNTGNPKFVQTSGDTLKAHNGHWSWEDGTPQSWASRSSVWGDTPESVTVSPYARTPLQERNNGITFDTMWSRAIEVDPTIIVLHTWNEFSTSGDENSPEQSQSIEPTKYHFTDTYAEAAKDYIAHFKSFRMDIGLYDTYGRSIYMVNRKDDYGSSTMQFGFQSAYAMDRGANVELLAGDFNGDGKTDIALRNIDNGTIAIRWAPYFTVEATGDRPAETIVTLEAGSRYKAFTGDFNGDGVADIGFYDTLGGSGGTGGFIIRYNDGSAGFSTSYNWAWALSGSYQYSSADINGDGKWDLVYRDPATGTIHLALAGVDGLQTKPTVSYTYSWTAGTGLQLFTGNMHGTAYHGLGLRNSSDGKFYLRRNLNTVTGTTWNFGDEQQYTWATGAHYLPMTGDFR